MKYPEFHHLGFKLVCGFMFYESWYYMRFSLMQQQKQIELLQRMQANQEHSKLR